MFAIPNGEAPFSRNLQASGAMRQGFRYGRFLQPDPIGDEGGMNLYAYVGNDPVNHTDSSGLCQDFAASECLDLPQLNLVREIDVGSSLMGSISSFRVSFQLESDPCLSVVPGACGEISPWTIFEMLHHGIKDTYNSARDYVQGCIAQRSNISLNKVANDAANRAEQGVFTGAAKGAVRGGISGGPGGAIAGAGTGVIKGTLTGSAAGAAESVIKQACGTGE